MNGTSASSSSHAHPRVLAVVGERERDRIEDALSSLSVETVSSVEAARGRLDTDSVDCLVVQTDRTEDISSLRAETDAPLVVVVHPDSGLSSTAGLDAGATDVVPLVESNLFERLPDRVESAVAWRRFGTEATGQITEDLKEQALDEAPVGITIADYTLPDRPLVYVNESFESMTGYSAAAALGRNCRYLQGPKTDPEQVAELREAIDAKESASVELLNYREDGETFWNRVDIAPLTGPNGEVTHFVGFQTDITERVRAEEAAETYARRVDEERARLQSLVEHIEGLLEDVTSALVRAETRRELEATVCRRVAATAPFESAWIGDCDFSPSVIVPNEWSGEHTAFIEGLEIDRDDTDDPTARAVHTLTVESTVADETASHDAASAPGRSAIAVPLIHRETLYGVLTVYGDAAELDDEVAVVFGTLGRAVGAAIDAFESRRSLLSDDVLELEFDVSDSAQPLVSLAEAGDCRLAYEGAVPHDDGTLSLFVSVTPPAQLTDVDTEIDGVVAVSKLPRGDDAGLYEVVLESGSLTHLVADAGGRLTDLEATRTGSRFTAIVPDRAVGRTLLDDLRTVATGVELRAVRDRSSPARTRREFASSVGADLTDRQHTALQLAYLGGFFDWPHGVTGDELADAMGVSRATFHQHLRAAERKLVTQFFDNDST
ncbi:MULTISPECIES: bacterio-opsin activator domain-containing protein [Haloferax]|uniref:PAS domain-containing protein n=1 Tax=Haloferax marinum TaxID=2666143 RepID=A0A6A8G5Y9_9EURY|nr:MULTISPECIES: bacterio-opsin activator domain-containing protein [Haloferax]KAB1197424.1 PAS domain-containing protein [Haloferax sp. CBA1150]MRW96469.1 PAS domain-containing protein [Haloferax marinum]